MKKKYQKHIIFIGIAIIIYWFFSSQYDYYLEADTIKFEFITRIKIAGVTLLILFFMQYKMHDYEKVFFKRVIKKEIILNLNRYLTNVLKEPKTNSIKRIY